MSPLRSSQETVNTPPKLSVVEEKIYAVGLKLQEFTGAQLVEAVIADQEPPQISLRPEDQARLSEKPVLEFMLGRFVVSKSNKSQTVLWRVSEEESHDPLFTLRVEVLGRANRRSATDSSSQIPHTGKDAPRELSSSQKRRQKKRAAYKRKVEEAEALGLPKPPNPLSRTGRAKIKQASSSDSLESGHNQPVTDSWDTEF